MNSRACFRFVLVAVLATVAVHAESRLRPRIIPKGTRATAADTPAGTRRHYLVAEEQLETVAAAGGQVVATLAGEGYVVSLAPGVLDLPEIDPESKISTELDLGTPATQTVIVEFFSDIARQDQEWSVVSDEVQLRWHPDLTETQLLIDANAERIRMLSRRDEVAYIFPASEELQRGDPVFACLNAPAGTPGAGQYIMTVGEGWDGPGRGEASLTYSWQRLTDKLPETTVKALIARALEEWAKHVRIQFTHTDATAARRNLNILFAALAHGDDFPFDGRGRVLAHTYFPNPPNPEPVAGDLHLDADESWHNGADIDLFSVVLHELGHALGLGHSDRPSAVMYPYYKRVSALAAEDIAAIRRLYAEPGPEPIPVPPLRLATGISHTTAAQSIDLTGTTTGGQGEVRVRWSDTRGHSGIAEGSRNWRIAAVALVTGTNTFRITATDAGGNEVSATVTVTRTAAAAPQIGLSSSNPVTGVYAGTASHASGIREVRWVNSAGGSGIARGTENWTAAVALQDGVNNLRFTAVAVDGSQASISLTVTAGGPDRTAPSLVIATPSGTSVATRQPTIRITGTAKDNAGVTQVRWSTSTGESGTASGMTSWIIDSVPLAVGQNVIVVRAYDAAGNSGWRTVSVTRQP
ncbi:MAG TPA: matrixin family metalloprotease [Bryobacteraceae bacterium]|nr:matrixin family metalloprotease [Bryobacteraceae bacterium]